MCHSAEARGYALLGDTHAFEASARRAAEALARRNPDEEPDWIAHFDRAHLSGEPTHCHLDLGQPGRAAQCAEEALAGLPATRLRRRAIILLFLASAHVQAGDYELGCETATKAALLVADLRSTLCAGYLSDFRRRLEPFAGVAAVREFDAWLEERPGSTVAQVGV